MSVHIQVERAQAASESTEVTVTLSFLQLYRETVQDLLAPVNMQMQNNNTSHGNDKAQGQEDKDNLVIREDPHRGFYVRVGGGCTHQVEVNIPFRSGGGCFYKSNPVFGIHSVCVFLFIDLPYLTQMPLTRTFKTNTPI